MDIEIKEVFFEIRRAFTKAEKDGFLVPDIAWEIVDEVQANYEKVNDNNI